ncbi:MAG: methyl-accepting chemotaxis protein [Calditrichaeota bacterium]|nr:methyl-accepting chemotaxis protein [Calditrichota bacterium]MCB9369753.1 methyl-accepting chemotaxis protein [Calditrichota bacterium]
MVVFGTIGGITLKKAAFEGSRVVQSEAVQLADKIDRNLFERYGDVQAFGLNRIIGEKRNEWYKRNDNQIVDVMNEYVATYGIYYLTIFCDLDGKVVAVNSKDLRGSKISSDFIYDTNFRNADWFTACLRGQFTTSMPFTAPENKNSTGTYIEDVHVDDIVKKAYSGDDGLTLGFSAPVHDASGKIIGVWTNRAMFSLVEEMVTASYAGLKKTGLTKAEITILDKDGKIIVDHDPTIQGGDNSIKRDLNSVLLKFNLADKGVEPARRAVKGETGYMKATHARKQVEQICGYTHLKGAMGYPGMNWSVLVRIDEAEVMPGTLSARTDMFLASLVLVLLIGLLSWTVGRGFSKPIARAAESMSVASKSVAAASNEIQSTSHTLANGANEQASSVEEISSSLEEMSAMTKQNAANSVAASDLMHTTSSTVQKAEGATSEMVDAMELIRQSSDQTSKIVKTIDEIAFQTNLLALNAAVEAARAGESGKGFAVVAEEVRSLAIRAAEAARDTSSLIQGTMERVETGVRSVSGVKEFLSEVNSAVSKATGLTKEISAATSEQSQGIEQINIAVAQVDRITQQNAAAAEESASASSQMNQQANDMSKDVRALLCLVRGDKTGDQSC